MSGDRPVPDRPRQGSKNTVRCCDHWPVLVFLTEARGILRLRLTITYHEGRGSEKPRHSPPVAPRGTSRRLSVDSYRWPTRIVIQPRYCRSLAVAVQKN